MPPLAKLSLFVYILRRIRKLCITTEYYEQSFHRIHTQRIVTFIIIIYQDVRIRIRNTTACLKLFNLTVNCYQLRMVEWFRSRLRN